MKIRKCRGGGEPTGSRSGTQESSVLGGPVSVRSWRRCGTRFPATESAAVKKELPALCLFRGSERVGLRAENTQGRCRNYNTAHYHGICRFVNLRPISAA